MMKLIVKLFRNENIEIDTKENSALLACLANIH
jgi:hypothetical protein